VCGPVSNEDGNLSAVLMEQETPVSHNWV